VLLVLFLSLEVVFGSISQAHNTVVGVPHNDGVENGPKITTPDFRKVARLLANLLSASHQGDDPETTFLNSNIPVNDPGTVNTAVRDAWFETIDQVVTLIARLYIIHGVVRFFEVEACHQLSFDGTPDALYSYPLNPSSVESEVFNSVYEKADTKAKAAKPKAARHMWLTPENIPAIEPKAVTTSLLQIGEDKDKDDTQGDTLPVRRTRFSPDPQHWRDERSSLPGFCGLPLKITRVVLSYIFQPLFVLLVIGSIIYTIVMTIGITMKTVPTTASSLLLSLSVLIFFVLFLVLNLLMNHDTGAK